MNVREKKGKRGKEGNKERSRAAIARWSLPRGCKFQQNEPRKEGREGGNVEACPGHLSNH